MTKARVYSVTFDGAERMVEANSQGQAEHHIGRVETARVKEKITNVHAASAIAVSLFVRGGGKIETAGVIPEPPKDPAERARSLLGGDESGGEGGQNHQAGAGAGGEEGGK